MTAVPVRVPAERQETKKERRSSPPPPGRLPVPKGGLAPHGLYAKASTMALKVALERIPLDAFSGSGS